MNLADNPAARTHQLNADWTIEADSLGGDVGGDQPVTFNINNVNAQLTVNLNNPQDAWTLGSLGTLNVLSAGTLSTSLAGSDVQVAGRINVEHAQRFTAQLHLAQSGIIDLRTASTVLYLNGGSSTELNSIAGGLISGAGTLASSTSGLTGFGTVNTDISFTQGADLKANGGTLVINGDILAADVVRVEQAGTLRVNTPFDTGNIGDLQMRGGRLVATTLTNSGVIEGYGSVEAQSLTNIGSLQGASGQTLVIDTVQAPNLDGIDGVNLFGTVEARFGSITIVDPLADSYSSTALVAAGQVLDFQAGWRLDVAGSLSFLGFNTPAVLRGGTTFLEGTVDVDLKGAIEARTLIQSSAVVNLNDANDELLLRGHTTISIGATFNGNGRVVNETGGRLEALSGAIVMVDVVNGGDMEINNQPGIIALRSFQQLGTGSLDIDLGSSAAESYQQLLLVEDALLDGTLTVGLLGGFAPVLNDSFTIISTNIGTVSGTFATTNLPELGSGLNWLVDYSDATAVVLRVVAAGISGDFDMNGDYACEDIDLLVAEIAAGTNSGAFDLTGDGAVDGDDLTAWLAEAGAAELGSGDPYLLGDANLDGVVDTSDFNLWNGSKFTSTAAWCAGDFNADGVVDTSDFNIWNGNKFQSSARPAAVPEPTSRVLWLCGLLACRWLRRSGRPPRTA